jgi:uncharacterized repeat protein (TIGR01451 family)
VNARAFQRSNLSLAPDQCRVWSVYYFFQDQQDNTSMKIRKLRLIPLTLSFICIVCVHKAKADGPIADFQEFQLIATNFATDFEFFAIGSDYFLAVANSFNDSSANVDSKIYRWDGAGFVEFQSIPTHRANDWKFFTIGNNYYLAVANNGNDFGPNVDSEIYRWDGTSFVDFQSIPTDGALGWEFFTISNDYYLAVANNSDGSSPNVDSKIYQWNGASFAEFQSIPTSGALDWAFLSIDGNSYLAVANSHNGFTPSIDSRIYRWNGTNFDEFQSIPTNGALDWEAFTIGSSHYLAVANYSDDSSFNIDSKLYQWNGTGFVEFQSIPTNGAPDWEAFTIGSNYYLAVANGFDGSTYNIPSRIYEWNGTNFVEFQSIPTSGAWDWEFFTIDDNYYLAVANGFDGISRNINSKIYRANTSVSDLSISKSVSPPGPVMPGQTITYTLAFSNIGCTTAGNVMITDTIPASLTHLYVISSGVTITETGLIPRFTWNVQDLAQNEGGSITVTGRVSPALTANTILVNTASITGSGDLSPTNNSDSRSVSIHVPRLAFSSATYSVSEGAGKAVITVTLNPPPVATVSVDYATSSGSAIPGSDYLATGGSLIFNPSTTVQTFTLDIIDDALAEATEDANLTLSNPSGAGLLMSSAVLRIMDDDMPGLTLTPASLSITEGMTATYQIRLNTQPTALVRLTLVSDEELSLSSTELTFTPLDWNQPQTIIVTAMVDNSQEGVHSSLITHTFISTDPAYASLSPVTLMVNLLDGGRGVYLPLILKN